MRVIFTGSNQDRLGELFSRSRAALYESASIPAFPRLGDDFLAFVSAHAFRSFRRRIPVEELFQPVWGALAPLQKQICRRLAAGGDVSSAEARKAYPDSLARSGISPGSISDALKALVDGHVLSKPAGLHGGYTFDDPLFREWLMRQR